MSWLSDAIGRNRNFAGNALKNIAPLAALIPGIGPLAAAGIAAGAGALGTGMRRGTNIGDILKQGAQSGTIGYGAAKALPGIKAIGGSLLGKATSATPATAGTAANAGGGAFGLGPEAIAAIAKAGGGGGGLPGLGSIGDFLTGNSGLNALAAAQLANSAYLGQKSSNFAEIAGKNADQAWAQKAPLRAQGVAGMDAGVAPVRLPGLAKISAAGNPWGRLG